MKNWLKNFGVVVLFGVFTTFLIIWLAYTVFILKSDPGLANAYVAIGTLILAIVTALLAGFTWLNIINSSEREIRYRKERLLNEIIEWSIDITRANFGGEIVVTSGVSEKIQKKRDMVNRLLQCQVLKVKGEELIQQFAMSINRELSDAVSQVSSSLSVVTGILSKGTPYAETEEAKKTLKSNDSVLEQNVRNLLNKVSKYRI